MYFMHIKQGLYLPHPRPDSHPKSFQQQWNQWNDSCSMFLGCRIMVKVTINGASREVEASAWNFSSPATDLGACSPLLRHPRYSHLGPEVLGFLRLLHGPHWWTTLELGRYHGPCSCWRGPWSFLHVQQQPTISHISQTFVRAQQSWNSLKSTGYYSPKVPSKKKKVLITPMFTYSTWS